MLKHLPHLNPDSRLIYLAVHLLNERCATSVLTAQYFMYNHFISNCSNFIFNTFFYHFKCFSISGFIVVIIFYDYFTSFYVKHYELPFCMKCAI